MSLCDLDRPRGVVRSVARATQHIDYSGLRWDKITPSNIDGVLDFSGRLFVFLEFKTVGAPMAFGQRLLFSNLHRAMARNGVACAVLLAEHVTLDPKSAIGASEALVVEILDGPQWRAPLRSVTVREAVESYLRRIFPQAL